MSIVRNAMLVRYEGGHVDVDVSTKPGSNRRETYLQLANVRTHDGAVGLARQQLALLRDDYRTTAFQGELRTGEQALGVGFHIGDQMDGRMIASTTVSIDVNGIISVLPEVDDPVKFRQDTLNRKIQLIAAGITSEYANPNTDKQSQGTGTDTTPQAFSYGGVLAASFSEVWTAPRPYQFSWLELVLGTAGSTASQVRVFDITNPSTPITLGTATIAAGDKRSVTVINRCIATGRKIVLGILTAGTGAADLTATPRGTMV